MNALVALCEHLRQASILNSVASLVGWDQETYMPPAGAEQRAEQQALLAELVHQRRTHPKLGELLAACAQDPAVRADPRAAALVREAARDYALATKLPGELVAELARVGSQAQHVWKEAREANDFPRFAPWLEKMFALSKRKAECLGFGPGGEAYDALLDEHEPGMTAREVEAIFTPLRQRLSALIARVAASGKKVDDSALKRPIPAAAQHQFGLDVLAAMGFDLNAGRLDTTAHPFCSGIAGGDTRLTTRYRDQAFTDALYSTMHEGGHGLYEQGLPKMRKATLAGVEVPLLGTPLADSVSLGIHESQSRMWENFVGRSRAFWAWAHPKASAAFGGALAGVSQDEIFRGVNTVTPSLIRVEADEGTYNLHVMIRFELERALLRGDLAVRDVPGAWNERYRAALGVNVPDDRRGCLQDVHWSFGLIGYFPTYTLGNLYAAQLWETIGRQIPDLAAKIAAGDFIPLRNWLNQHVHAPGREVSASELCRRVTGAPLSADPLMRHLEGRAKEVYGV